MRSATGLLTALVMVAVPAFAHAGDCGRPVNRGASTPRAGDALYILQSSIGMHGCRLEDCDVNPDCEIRASDALGGLTAAIDSSMSLECNSECPTEAACEDTGAPMCNGVCPAGQACVVREGDETDRRVTVCHMPPGNPDNAHTLVIGSAAAPAHLAHGDHLGPCEDDDRAPDAGSVQSGSKVEIECVCVDAPVPSSTTTSSTLTTSTVPETTTTVPATTTTIPGTTTTVPGTTTTVAETTTTVAETTTTMSVTTTTVAL